MAEDADDRHLGEDRRQIAAADEPVENWTIMPEAGLARERKGARRR